MDINLKSIQTPRTGILINALLTIRRAQFTFFPISVAPRITQLAFIPLWSQSDITVCAGGPVFADSALVDAFLAGIAVVEFAYLAYLALAKRIFFIRGHAGSACRALL